jgi:hypothetical protein
LRVSRKSERRIAPLRFDGAYVAGRIDASRRVRDVAVLEAADDVDQRFHLAYMGEETIAQPLPFMRSLYQAGDVHELHDRRHLLRRRHQLEQSVEARVRHLYNPDVGVDRCERIGLGGYAQCSERVEQRGLAGIG